MLSVGVRTRWLHGCFGRRLCSSQSSLDKHRQKPMLSPAVPATISRKRRWLPHFMTKEHITVSDASTVNRWRIVGLALATNAGLGSLLGWSIFNKPLCSSLGGVASASQDWALTEVTPVFGVFCMVIGLTSTTCGTWVQSVGARTACTAAGIFYAAGFAVSALGVQIHSLPLLYLGLGGLSGIGFGLGSFIPIQYLMYWFPDKKGLVSGIATAGFAVGALLSPIIGQTLLNSFFVAPEYLGLVNEVYLYTHNGVRFTDLSLLPPDITPSGYVSHLQANSPISEMNHAGLATYPHEVVAATVSDVAQLHHALPEGVYLVGTGNTGIGKTFNVMGCLSGISVLGAAFGFRLPPKEYVPQGWKPPSVDNKQHLVDISRNESLRTSQFWNFTGIMFCGPVPGFIIISFAATMLGEIFSSSLPGVVTPTSITVFVSSCAIANLAGRLSFGFLVDKIGDRAVFNIILTGSIVASCLVPVSTKMAYNGMAGLAPLSMFLASTLAINSFYGGWIATMAPYQTRIFGPKHMTAIYGTNYLGTSVSLLLAPVVATKLREMSVSKAIQTLAQNVDPQKFQTTFEAPVAELESLTSANTVTINRMMEIMPPETLDPSPLLYDSTLYICAVICGVGLLHNNGIRQFTNKELEIISAKRKKDEESDTEL